MPSQADHHRLSQWRIWVSRPCRENALCSWHTQVVLSCDKLAHIEEFLCCQSVNGGTHFCLFALLILIYLCFGTVLFAFCQYVFLHKFLVFQNFLIFWFFIFLICFCHPFSPFNPFCCQFICSYSHLTEPNKRLQPASAMTIDKLESSSNALFGGSSSPEPIEDLGIVPRSQCAMLVAY